jgi:molybdenum cofactor cytidylyltransferase
MLYLLFLKYLFIITLMNPLGKSPNSSIRLAVLLLAAGEGSRLGSHPKALLKRNGQSLLRRFCSSLAVFEPVEFIVVTGFHADLIESEIHSIEQASPFPINVVRNVSSKDGQATSVRLGLESLHSQYDVLLVALSDQPGIGAPEVQALLDEYSHKENDQEVILPIVDQRRGNPVLFSYAAVNDILAIPGMVCRPYMDKHPEQVRLLKTHLQAFVLDVDTFEDIQREKLTLS